MLAPGLLVVHDAERGRQHDVPELRHEKQTGRREQKKEAKKKMRVGEWIYRNYTETKTIIYW